MYRMLCLALVLACSPVALPAAPAPEAAEAVDLAMVTRIRDEGFHRSRVMETLEHLTEIIGPRLTGSPQMKEANDWTLERMKEFGLENAHLEPFEFGRGWSFSYAAVHMVQPHAKPLLALPRAWTPGTDGAVRGEVMKVEIESKEDLEKYRGKVAGKILFTDPPREIEATDTPRPRRYDGDNLVALEEFEVPGERGESPWRQRRERYRQLRKALNEFLVEEKALATVEVSSRNHGILRLGGGGSREKGESPGVTGLSMAAEHYNHVLRLLDLDRKVELEIEVKARFYDGDLNAYNSVAEIPGTDKADEVVMAGGHLDSWHPGTGATDNAASCAVAMEAARILEAVGAQPRRTIRIALWSGEEQGLLGSEAYVKEHFATRPEPEKDENGEEDSTPYDQRWPLTLKPDHAKLSAYFNLDNGGGRIRGIYAQENVAAGAVFEKWLEPFHDLGATTVTLRNTGSTDHVPFDRVGLPGFQFIQDGLDYFTLTHHTHLDVLDYVEEQDLKQAAVVLATFLYQSAMREELLPRKPVPQKPPERPERKRQSDDDDERGGRGGRGDRPRGPGGPPGYEADHGDHDHAP